MDATGAPIERDPVLVGERAKHATGELLPASVLDCLCRNGLGLKGPITTPVGEGMPSVNVRLRKKLKWWRA